MAAKVLTGDATAPAESVIWRRLGPEDSLEGGHAASGAVQARLAQLEQEIPQREQQAYTAGYHKGEAAGAQQAATRLEPVAEQLARTVAELAQTRRKLRRDAELDVVKLALAIGKRIIHRELSIDPEAILGVVKAALERLEGREVDRLRVSPEDAEIVRKGFERLGAACHIEVTPDARLSRGSAVFETARGNLDASVETQLEEIQRGLVDRMRQR